MTNSAELAESMRFEALPVQGAFTIDLDRREDERGFFARLWCVRDLSALGLEANFVQSSISFSPEAGTVRGMHYQEAPSQEVRIVTCAVGAIYDVIVDLRPESPSFKRWHAVKLDGGFGRSVYVPRGCAHGLQTLVAGSVVQYTMSAYYDAERARSLNWRDPELAIPWPIAEATAISPRDATAPFLNEIVSEKG